MTRKIKAEFGWIKNVAFESEPQVPRHEEATIYAGGIYGKTDDDEGNDGCHAQVLRHPVGGYWPAYFTGQTAVIMDIRITNILEAVRIAEAFTEALCGPLITGIYRQPHWQKLEEFEKDILRADLRP